MFALTVQGLPLSESRSMQSRRYRFTIDFEKPSRSRLHVRIAISRGVQYSAKTNKYKPHHFRFDLHERSLELVILVHQLNGVEILVRIVVLSHNCIVEVEIHSVLVANARIILHASGRTFGSRGRGDGLFGTLALLFLEESANRLGREDV